MAVGNIDDDSDEEIIVGSGPLRAAQMEYLDYLVQVLCKKAYLEYLKIITKAVLKLGFNNVNKKL